MSVNWDKVDEAALALMHLTTSIERNGVARSWKGFDWDILDRMCRRGWISDPQTKAKSVVVFDDAVRRSKALFEELFSTAEEPSDRRTTQTIPPAIVRGAGHCECGCGAAVQNHDFVPGHDQKLRIQLEQRTGGLLALRDLLEALEEHARGESGLKALSASVRKAFEEAEQTG